MAARPAPIIFSPLAAEVDASLKVLDDLSLTAETYAKSVVKQVNELTFPSTDREAAARSELGKFAQRARDLRLNDDARGLRRAAAQLQRSAEALARPIPGPSPAEVVRSYHLVQNHGWPPGTIEFLIDHLQPSDFPLGKADAKGIQTASRRITIDELVTYNRPRAMTDEFYPRWKASVMRPALGSPRPVDEDLR